MSKFYTSFMKNKNSCLVRGYDNGEQFFENHELTPILYNVKDRNETDKDQRSIFGDYLEPIEFKNSYEARKYMNDAEASVRHIYGFPFFEYSKIKELNFDTIEKKYIKKMYFDIETYVGEDNDYNKKLESAFPSPQDAVHPISVITCILNKSIYVISLKPLNESKVIQSVKNNINRKLPEDLSFKFICNYNGNIVESEKQLLLMFIALQQSVKPDVLSGWNSDGFDIPYLCHRITKVLGESYLKKLSPFGIVYSRNINTGFGKSELRYEIGGVNCTDYMQLYKKIELSPRENYRLDTIANIELGQGKLEFDGTFQDFYENNWDEFVAYNIVDVLLLQWLDDTLGFMDVGFEMSQSAQCNLNDIFRVTRIWDCIINHYCVDNDMQVPTWFHNGYDGGYEGAYVKPTIPGDYKWCISFDIASLYPSIIMQNNISPETILPIEKFPKCTAHDLTNKTDVYKKALEVAKENNATLAANGSLYSKENYGILPTLIEIFMKKRKDAKAVMKETANKLEYAKLKLSQMENV